MIENKQKSMFMKIEIQHMDFIDPKQFVKRRDHNECDVG